MADSEANWYALETDRRFAQSSLWDLQRRFFDGAGVHAWSQGVVPHYVTNNPTVANGYAEIVFAFWRDQQRCGRYGADEPLYICELGAGSGRLAFHFLTRLVHLCHQAQLATIPFRYVLTDIAESTLDFWRQHPRFHAFFANGLLDLALFDLTQSTALDLRVSQRTISAGSLERPWVVIANYVFDGIPHDLYSIKAKKLYHALISLSVDADPATLVPGEILARVQARYRYEAAPAWLDDDPALQAILADYQHTLTDTHLLFPAAGLRGIQRLRALSQRGVLMLSADKGQHTLAALEGRDPPVIVRHGSISLDVNYHALKAYCERQGGIAWFPAHRHTSITVGCLVFCDAAAEYHETQRAYQRHVQDFSPDDFYSITKHANKCLPSMEMEDILAYLRLSAYDSQQFARYAPRLLQLAATSRPDERASLCEAIDRVWDLYFPLGEDADLAYAMAAILYDIDEYAAAIAYFERSLAWWGSDTGTLYNLAACHHMLGDDTQAKTLLETVLAVDAENENARELWQTLHAEMLAAAH